MSEIKIQLIATWKAYNCDTTKDDMEDETEPNVYDQYKEYVKQEEVKQLKLTKRWMLLLVWYFNSS